MINILFFAHLKETLGCEKLQLEAQELTDIASLRAMLATKGDAWASQLGGNGALVAVNQAMANEQTVLKSGDEVAFFPPVTGG
jgi:molybdopterin synthase sulfur carrier subunit